ncbi:viral CC-type chemokine [Finch poxvirus]|uniref:Viral CC-type chemokine n=1 Tax=Condorpox virus TaxID=3049970 RepID=A0AAT9UPI2_9POXV|nr:viral CC-type chemokine [Finch poxvirus]UOX39053.1 viral CC-type chemokine [Finch poxvirus]
MRYEILICFLISIHSFYCYRPDCDMWCCEDKKKHQEELDQYEKCKIKCYARSKRSIEDGVSGPHIGESGLPLLEHGGDSFSHLGHPSPNPIIKTPPPTTTTKKKKKSKKEREEEKEKKLTECISNCNQPELKSFGCGKECCEMIDKINSIRNGTATYQCQARCCNGRYISHKELDKRLTDEGKSLFELMVDCRRVGDDECPGEGGYMITLSNLSTICFPSDEVDYNLGLYYNRKDECGKLYGIEDASGRSLSYPVPVNVTIPNNPYGGLFKGSNKFCRMPK